MGGESPAMSDVARSPWIALANAGGLVAMAAAGASERLRVVPDVPTFASLLDTGRPVIAILAVPPATEIEIDRAVRERRRRSTLRIVHLSPPDAVEARLAALRAGFDAVLCGDISGDELMARLELLDEAARARNHAHLPIGEGVVLDPIAHEVRRDGALVHLRPKEYQLLAMLAAHPGRAYTRRQLLDRVWGPGHDGDPRTVDVHVRWLRAKIERRPEVPVHLVTVRGVGYRLDPVGR